MISPLDIRQQSFGKAMRGYNSDEVRAYLQSLSQEWERVLDDNKRLKSELDKATERLKSYTEMEDIMRKTLHQAEQTARSTQEAAQREAELKIAEASQRAKAIIAEAELERSQIQHSMQDLLDKKHQVVGQLKAFLKSELQEIASYEENLVRKMAQTAKALTPLPVAEPQVPAAQDIPAAHTAPTPPISAQAVPQTPEPSPAPRQTLPVEKSAPTPVAEPTPHVSLKPDNRSFFEQVLQPTKPPVVVDLSQDL
jgi:cell division initiation protein